MPDGSDVVPILGENGERRYVAPNDPTGLMYGASHLHAERRVVERQHKTRSSKPSMKLQNVRPMMTLPEDSPIDSVMTWVKSVSTQLFASPSEPTEPEPQFAFKDFPRHDGTPCLMYNPNASPLQRKQEEEQFSIEMGQLESGVPSSGSQHGLPNNSQHSASSTGSLEVFIDRLENLYALKKRQYEQRKEMEDERQKRSMERRKVTGGERVGPVGSRSPGSVATTTTSMPAGSQSSLSSPLTVATSYAMTCSAEAGHPVVSPERAPPYASSPEKIGYPPKPSSSLAVPVTPTGEDDAMLNDDDDTPVGVMA